MANEEKLPRGINLTSQGYRLRLTWKSKQVHCGTYETLGLAKIARELYRGQIVAGTFVPPVEVRRQERAALAAEKAQRMTLAQWSDKWLKNLENAIPARSPGTLATYRSTMKVHVLPMLGAKQLKKITTEDVQQCVAKASAGGHDGAGQNLVRTLRACLNAAISEGAGGLETNPVTGVKVAAGRRRGDEEIPTLEELRAITANLPPQLQLAAELGAWCSLRVSEVLGLQRQDLRHLGTPGHATLTVARQWSAKSQPPQYADPKEGSFRTIAIPPALVPRVKAHLAEYVDKKPTAPVFPSTVDSSRPMSHNSFTARWNKAREGVHPGLVFHSLRHFGLTMYSQVGASTVEYMRRGGHKDLKAAAGYQHGSAARDQELAALLSAVIEKEN